MAEEAKQEEIMFMAFAEEANDVHKKSWLLDSGCTHHMCGDAKSFEELDQNYKFKANIGNGDYVAVEGKGTGSICTPEGTKYIPMFYWYLNSHTI